MKKCASVFLLALFSLFVLFGCGGGDSGDDALGPIQQPKSEVPEEKPKTEVPIFETSVIEVAIKNINAADGGEIEVNAGTAIDGLKLTIPADALEADTEISIGAVNSPPALPVGLNFVGTSVNFGPDGTQFITPARIAIPYTDEDLETAGVLDAAGLKVYSYDQSSGIWTEAKILYIDSVKKIVYCDAKHFSIYSLVGLGGFPPLDLGTPQPGDILFKLSTYDHGKTNGWIPGHEGVYTGEKKWNGIGLASDEVKRCGFYNTVEALWGGVQYSYYKIPNTIQSCPTEAKFEGESVYMGARQAKDFDLTAEQRNKIVEYVEQQVGKPYVQGKSFGVLFGLLDGWEVKGPSQFNCIGLAEKAYEVAGVNGGQGLLIGDEYNTPSPAMAYRKTEPAGGKEAAPIIQWASLTPDSGTKDTLVLAEIAVSHPYGSDFIESVTYAADDGYVNPNIYINDQGIRGDVTSGDGIYSAQSRIGGDSSLGTLGLNFTVIDKNGNSVNTKVSFKYDQ